ncbi:MAG: phosphoribosylanthranilate isomerase [Muribaculaceae bacterium]|nr:phosphoribosylanthranilate isomerase [Muribaculaceae bacterium]
MTQSDYTTPRHSDMLIKVCGMKYPDNIADVAALTPMLMGFIFYEGSPRFAGNLDPESVVSLPDFVRPVALFVNAEFDQIIATIRRYGINIVQLHGDESPELCQRLRTQGLIVARAIAIAEPGDFARVNQYKGAVDFIVFDSKTPRHGGSGKKFDWNLLAAYDGSIPYLIGGGVGPDDVDNIVAAMRPGMMGIDLNSCFEQLPGVKDIMLLSKFILTLRKNNEDDTPAKPFWEK